MSEPKVSGIIKTETEWKWFTEQGLRGTAPDYTLAVADCIDACCVNGYYETAREILKVAADATKEVREAALPGRSFDIDSLHP